MLRRNRELFEPRRIVYQFVVRLEKLLTVIRVQNLDADTGSKFDAD
jgi:hypothetical protein